MSEEEIPKVGEGWRGQKGGLYKIICIGHRISDGNKVVVYKCVSDYEKQIWVRSLDEFLGYEFCGLEDNKKRFTKERDHVSD